MERKKEWYFLIFPPSSLSSFYEENNKEKRLKVMKARYPGVIFSMEKMSILASKGYGHLAHNNMNSTLFLYLFLDFYSLVEIISFFQIPS